MSITYIKEPIYRNTIFLILSSILCAGCGFFFWMIAAKTYSIENVGLATAFISSLGLVVMFSMLGFDVSIIRFFPNSDRASAFNTSLVITAVASFIIGASYILFSKFLIPSLAFLSTPIFAIAFLFICIANTIASIAGYTLVAARRADYYFYQNILLAIRVLFLLPLMFLGPLGIPTSLGIGCILASAFSLLILEKKFVPINLKVDKKFAKTCLKFSSWNYISNILYSTPTLILPIMVFNLLGESEAAKYYIVFTFGNQLLLIPLNIGTSLFVEGSHGEGLKKSALHAGMACLLLLLPAVLFICIFGEQLLGLINKDYRGAFELLRILAFSSFLVAIYSLYIPIQNVRMKIQTIVNLSIIRFVLLLGLSYILILKFGILGAGYAWIITYGILVLLIARIVRSENWI